MPRLLAALVIGSFFSPLSAARADTFMGVEGEGGNEAAPNAKDDTNADQEKPVPKKEKKHAKKVEPEDNDDDSDSSPPLGDRLTFAFILGGGSHVISGQAILGYSVNRYVGINTSAYYYRYEDGDTTGNQYGPEVDLVLRLPNPTIVTPFVGAGPGYFKWIREYKGQSFDENSSFTVNSFAGINIALTKHFGLHLQRKQIMYVGNVPRSFDDPSLREPRTQMETDIGFHASF